jgi:hypothetical protein
MRLGLTRNPDWECSRKAMGGQIGGTAKSGGCGDCCTSERGCQRDPIATTHSVVLNTILLIRFNVKQTNHVSTCSSTPPHLPRHARSRPLSPTPPHGRQRLFFRRGRPPPHSPPPTRHQHHHCLPSRSSISPLLLVLFLQRFHRIFPLHPIQVSPLISCFAFDLSYLPLGTTYPV